MGIHGKLDPLVQVDLTPEKRVKVTFTYGDLVEVSVLILKSLVFFILFFFFCFVSIIYKFLLIIIKKSFFLLLQVRSVDVYRTVFELKTKLETMVKIPANRMRLFYVDQVS